MSLTEEIHVTFRKAALQAEAARGLKPSDWKHYREIQDAHTERLRHEERRYRDEYDTRVEAARLKLIDEAGQRGGLTFINKVFGRDKFDPAAIERQARRNVRADHYHAILHLESEKNARIDDLLHGADQRQAAKQEIKQQPERTTDRRSGADRRQSGPDR